MSQAFLSLMSFYFKNVKFTINLGLNHSKYVTLSMSVGLMLHLEKKVRKKKKNKTISETKNLRL